MSIKKTWPNGAIEWGLDGLLHKINGPAYIYPDGTQEWYKYGKLHREDGPAYIDVDGTQQWYINGQRHRESGPALMYSSGSQYWYVNGKLHREPHNGVPMPVIVKKDRISYDGKTFIPITEDDYEKYRYQPTGRFTKSART